MREDLVLIHVRATAHQGGPAVMSALRRDAAHGFAGIVESVATGVTGFAPGDAVYGIGTGAFGAYLCVRESHISHMPATLDFDQAAQLAQTSLTSQSGV